MKPKKKTIVIGLLIAVAVAGLWMFSTVWFINVLAVVIIVLGLILSVRGLLRLWRWKKAAAMGLLGILVVFGLWAFFYEGAGPKTFIDEVKAVRATNRSATQIPIHDLVSEYIPVGTREDIALEFCTANGLGVYPVREKRHVDSKKYDEVIVCSRKDIIRWDLLWWFWIGSDEVRVNLYIKDGVIAQVKGFIFFHSL